MVEISIFNIKNKYILRQIFDNLQQNKVLNIIRYNKIIQSILYININDYKKNSNIETETIPGIIIDSEDEEDGNNDDIINSNKTDECCDKIVLGHKSYKKKL